MNEKEQQCKGRLRIVLKRKSVIENVIENQVFDCKEHNKALMPTCNRTLVTLKTLHFN